MVFGSDALLIGVLQVDENGLEEDAERDLRAAGRVRLVDDVCCRANGQADQDVLGPGLDLGRAIGIVPRGPSV